jgi:hypothetical protein
VRCFLDKRVILAMSLGTRSSATIRTFTEAHLHESLQACLLQPPCCALRAVRFRTLRAVRCRVLVVYFTEEAAAVIAARAPALSVAARRAIASGARAMRSCRMQPLSATGLAGSVLRGLLATGGPLEHETSVSDSSHLGSFPPRRFPT